MQSLSPLDKKLRFIAHAEKYVERGWHVLSCKGKVAFGKAWNQPNAERFSATLDKKKFNYFFEEGRQVGILCGKPSGITVVDVDCKEGQKGWENWLKICELCGIANPENPGTYRVRTGGGGWHFYFQYEPVKKPSGAEPNAALFENVDIQNDGKFIVAPPSVHPQTFKEYTTAGDLDGRAVLPMPPKLKELLSKEAAKEAPPLQNSTPAAQSEISAFINATLAKVCGSGQVEKAPEPPKIEFAYDFKEADLEEAARMHFAPQYTTGLPSLDAMLGGGWQAGEFYVLGGQTGIGKTAFALQAAEACALAGFKVIYFTLEVPRRALTSRLISKWTWQAGYAKGFSTRGVYRGDLNKESHAGFYESHKECLQRLAFVEGAPNGVAVDDLEAYLTAFVEKFNAEPPPLVIVDYFQILKSAIFGDSDKQRIDGVVYGLKQLCNKFRAPFLALSSLNRGSYNSLLSLNAFKESGSVEYTADAVLGIELAGAADAAQLTEAKRAFAFSNLAADFRQSVKEKGKGHVHLKVLKNRNGECGTLGLAYAPAQNIFEENAECISGEPLADKFAQNKSKPRKTKSTLGAPQPLDAPEPQDEQQDYYYSFYEENVENGRI